MMESCLAGAPERLGPVEVDDLRRDLLGEFAALPAQQESVQSENLQVYLRIRPLTAAESDSGASQDCVTIEGLDSVVLKAPRSCQSNRQSEKSLPQTAQRFTFTQVFGPEAGQRAVFDGSVRALVRDVLDGGNCLVFTYGVTNAGKTFTFLGPEHDSGLLPRSLSLIFTSVEGRLYGGCDLKPQRCRDYSRLTPDQQAAESGAKRNLLRLFKESDKSLMSSRSTLLDGSALSADSSVSDCDSFCLNTAPNVRFSIWVSFCEIYNDNIHDLLEQVHGGHHRRTVLRLSQDVRGNSFIKDLRWVQVNSSEEAYRVMKIGKKNQSFSSTRLNQLSSRSHSIFSVRILKIDNVGVPRVLGISELSLCDLAGSERCSRTQNTGERLKEAGNINNSLLTLGKCINAMRLNQNAKFQHHIPFRESKLTHFLQFFFCGAGRVSMVVNVNQSASCFDETLNVLKFSALAQKVVVLNTRPVVQDEAPHRSAMELSMIIDEADLRRNVSGRGRKSSMVAWETSLEDVLEDDDGEEWEVEEEESAMEGTVLEAAEEAEKERTMEVEQKTDREAALRLVLEAQIREEVSTEFMELFNKMEEDYRDRLEKEREILEERADKRVEILRNLISRTVDSPPTTTNTTTTTNNNNKEEQAVLLQGIISTLTNDLEKIREDAQSVQHCLTEQTHTEELEMLRLEKQQSHDRLQEAEERLEQQQQKLSELMEMCQQKDDIINKLQAAMDATVEEATRDRALVESIRTELLQLQQTCHCPRRSRGEEEDDRKRQRQSLEEEEEDSAPARKRAVLEEEIWRLQEENDKKEEMIVELREREGSRRGLEENLTRREEEIEQLKKEQVLLEQKVEKLTDLDECPNCDSVFSSLEAEQKETSRLTKENKALVNGIFQLQTEMTSLQTLLKQQIDRCDSQSEQLNTAKTRLQELESQSEEKAYTINRLSNEVEHLKQEVKEEEEGRSNNISVFHDAMDELKKESQAALERSAQKSQQIRDLQREKVQLDETLTKSQKKCVELTEELNNQKAAFSCQLQSLRAELESEGGALRGQLEEMEREQEREREERRRVNSEKEQLIEESYRHTEALRRELERLKEDLQRREEEENQNLEERKEEIQRREEEENQILEERKKEIQRREEEENQILEERKKEIQRREEEENQILEERKEEIQRRGEVENHILEERKEGIQRREEEENQILEERKKEIQRREEEENQILEERKEEIQSREEEEEEKENLALEDRKVPVVEELKEVIQKLKEKRGRQHKEEEEYEAVKREVERLKREKEERETRRCGGRVLPQQDAYVSPLRSNMADRKKMAQTTGKKRKSCDVEGLAFSENKRNRLRGNARNTKQSSSSSVKEKRDGTLQKIGDLIHNSPSILGSKAKTIMGLVTGHSPNTETLPTTSKPRRGRRKLYKANASSPLLDSPHTTSGGAEDEEKESDHLIIKRQLRSKTCRK